MRFDLDTAWLGTSRDGVPRKEHARCQWKCQWIPFEDGGALGVSYSGSRSIRNRSSAYGEANLSRTIHNLYIKLRLVVIPSHQARTHLFVLSTSHTGRYNTGEWRTLPCSMAVNKKSVLRASWFLMGVNGCGCSACFLCVLWT